MFVHPHLIVVGALITLDIIAVVIVLEELHIDTECVTHAAALRRDGEASNSHICFSGEITG